MLETSSLLWLSCEAARWHKILGPKKSISNWLYWWHNGQKVGHVNKIHIHAGFISIGKKSTIFQGFHSLSVTIVTPNVKMYSFSHWSHFNTCNRCHWSAHKICCTHFELWINPQFKNVLLCFEMAQLDKSTIIFSNRLYIWPLDRIKSLSCLKMSALVEIFLNI